MKETARTIGGFVEFSPEISRILSGNPFTVVDVGAAGGVSKDYTRYPDICKIIAFEPDKEEYDNIVSKAPSNVKIFNTGLAGVDGPRTLFLAKKRQCSSLIPPNVSLLSEFGARRFFAEKSVTVQCRNLQNILYENMSEDVDFIKIDTQGTELEILRGAEDILRNYVTGIHIEAEFLELYESQPLFCDVHTYLTKLGFVVEAFDKIHWKLPGADKLLEETPRSNGLLSFVNLRYWKLPADVARSVNRLGRQKGREKIVRTLMNYAVHRVCDFMPPLISALEPGTFKEPPVQFLK